MSNVCFQVKCIDNAYADRDLFVGNYYYVVEEKHNEYGVKKYKLSRKHHWWNADRFVRLENKLQPGWKRCVCGTITSNSDMCCGCRK
jgi:hypothetical protein